MLNLGYLSHFKRNNIICKQIAMVVLQLGEHSSVNNSRPAGKEVTGTRKVPKGVTEILEKMKKRKREVKVQFKREPLIIFHGPD